MLWLLKAVPAFLLSLIAVTRAETQIVSGAAWTDTSGNIIQAHGAGILKVNAVILPCE